jgi:hypothetical protein
VKFPRQKLSKYYAELTPTNGMLRMSAHILDPFRKLRLFRKCDKEMDTNPENETFYTTQYQEEFQQYVVNEYYPKHRRVPVNKLETLPTSNLVPTATSSGYY